MKGGKGGMGRSGGKPNRGGKPAGKPAGRPAGRTGAGGKPAPVAKFAGLPKRGEAKASFGGRSTAEETSSNAAVTVQRTLNVPASAVIRAINDADRRGWSPEPLYRVMSVLAPRFIRIAFPDGSLAAFSVNRQGNARCTVTVELSRLPAGANEKQLRDRWSYALAALQDQVDHSWE
jgi:hypothetical protein